MYEAEQPGLELEHRQMQVTWAGSPSAPQLQPSLPPPLPPNDFDGTPINFFLFSNLKIFLILKYFSHSSKTVVTWLNS